MCRLQFTLLICSIQCFQLTSGLHRGSSSSLVPKACLSCRGGQQQYSNDPYATNANYNTYYNNHNYNQQNLAQDPDHIFQESVQDRVDQWRQEQIQHRQEMPTVEKTSLRESNGRVKLLANLGNGSRAALFGVLMWRNLVLMEAVDKTIKSRFKGFFIGLLTALLLGNFAGVAAALTGTTGHAAKNRFKAILNLDKLLEIVLLFWYFLRLTIIPNKHIQREIYIASISHSIFFLIQCHSFTKLSW